MSTGQADSGMRLVNRHPATIAQSRTAAPAALIKAISRCLVMVRPCRCNPEFRESPAIVGARDPSHRVEARFVSEPATA